MQAFSLTKNEDAYILIMQTGRPSSRPRPPFGERIHALREQAGFSQAQLAEKIGLSQRAYAYWERNPVALRPDQLLKLATTLNVSVDELMGAASKKRGSGPVGKMHQLFEAASHLPRSQQQKVTALLEAFVFQHGNGQKQAV